MKVTYRGPGESVEIDGLAIRRGEAIDVTREQYERLVRSDDAAVVEVASTKADTPEEALRIRSAQNRQREKAARESSAEEKRRRTELEEADKKEADRAQAAAEKGAR